MNKTWSNFVVEIVKYLFSALMSIFTKKYPDDNRKEGV